MVGEVDLDREREEEIEADPEDPGKPQAARQHQNEPNKAPERKGSRLADKPVEIYEE